MLETVKNNEYILSWQSESLLFALTDVPQALTDRETHTHTPALTDGVLADVLGREWRTAKSLDPDDRTSSYPFELSQMSTGI